MHVMIAGQTETHTQIKPLTKVSFHHLILCRPVQLRSRASKHVVHRAMPIATPTALETDTRSLEKGYQALFAGFVSVNPNASVGLFLQTPEWDMVQPTLKILRARHKAHEADVEQMAIAVLQRPTNMYTKPVTDANHLAKPTLATKWQLTPHGRSHFPRRPSTLIPVQEAIPGPHGLGQKRQWWDDE